MEVKVNEIYRHATGSFYEVIALSKLMIGSVYRDVVVVRKLSAGNVTATYFLEDFLSEVGKLAEDKLGQKFLFVKVKDAALTLAETTTEALVEELKNRPNNPYAKEGDPKVFDVFYEVGVLKPVNPSYAEYEGQQYFDVIREAPTLEDAIDFVKHHRSKTRRPVFMRVTRTVETTVRDIIDSISLP